VAGRRQRLLLGPARQRARGGDAAGQLLGWLLVVGRRERPQLKGHPERQFRHRIGVGLGVSWNRLADGRRADKGRELDADPDLLADDAPQAELRGGGLQ
jgi:hypothetical protein